MVSIATRPEMLPLAARAAARRQLPAADAVLLRLFAQPSEVQALCLGHLDADALDAIIHTPAWPPESRVAQALTLACHDRYLGRCAPAARQLARLAPPSPEAPPPDWRQLFADQQALAQEVRRAWQGHLAEDLDAPWWPPGWQPMPRCYSWPQMALQMAVAELAEDSALDPDATDDVWRPATGAARASAAAARRALGQRALQLLGLSGADLQQSPLGQRVAAQSMACLGHKDLSADLFTSAWAATMPELTGPVALRRRSPRGCADAFLTPVKQAAIALGSVSLYKQLLAWGHDASVALYSEAYDNGNDVQAAIFAGHAELVQAMMQARGRTYTELELRRIVTVTGAGMEALAGLAGQGGLDAAHQAQMQAAFDAVVQAHNLALADEEAPNGQR